MLTSEASPPQDSRCVLEAQMAEATNADDADLVPRLGVAPSSEPGVKVRAKRGLHRHSSSIRELT